ncbi:MAG: transposase, partial [Deltaproteobacteria bacterium]|nr:transposase [Deltaproteobacteria bacterium]
MRKARKISKGATYHIVAQTNRGEFLMDTPVCKEMFLDVLSRAKEKYHFKLKHFCIMSNHIHLLIEPVAETKLSKLMQWGLSVFAAKINKFFGLKGHVWHDRFKS